MVEAAAETSEPESESKGKTTMGELGLKMPLGIIHTDGSYSKGFKVKPWRMTEEKELAQYRQDGEGQNVATYVSTVVAYMCSVLGHHNFADMDMTERKVIVSQMYMGDVWYVYAYIRREALGSLLKLMLKCPRCRKDFPFTADLTTLNVTAADTLDDTLWEYKLNTPIDIRGKKAEVFYMGPQRWTVAESVFTDPNSGTAKEVTFRASIRALNDPKDQIQLADGEIDDLVKLDIEAIASQIDDHFIGPDMSIELGADDPCGHCKYKAKRLISIDWTFDSFFGSSSH